MKKIFITGANGLLGQAIVSLFTRESNYQLVLSSVEDKPFLEYGHPYVQLDITDKESVKEIIAQHSPDVIINCAAFTEVGKEPHNRFTQDGVEDSSLLDRLYIRWEERAI